jgi:CBS domain-containing protein
MAESKHSQKHADDANATIREAVRGARNAARQGATAVHQGSRAAGAALRQGGQAAAEATRQGSDAVRRGAQEWAETQRNFAQIAVEQFEAVGTKVLQAMQQATEDLCTLMMMPNAARGSLSSKDVQSGIAGIVEGVMQTNVRATQEFFRLADPSAILDLQRRFAREYFDALLQGSATVVRAARLTAEETLRPLEADIEQRRQARDAEQGRSSGSGSRHDGKVGDVMSTQVRVIGPDDTVQHAARLMREQDIGALPVNEGDKLVGMVTDRDVALRLVAEGRDAGRTKVREVMTSGVRYVFDDEELSHAAENMAEQKVRRLPVVNRDKRLVGVLSLGDLALNGNQRWLAGRALANTDDGETAERHAQPAAE